LQQYTLVIQYQHINTHHIWLLRCQHIYMWRPRACNTRVPSLRYCEFLPSTVDFRR